jgi:fructosamine-3-kinase
LIEQIIEKSLGSSETLINSRPLGGGCINQASKIETGSGIYFLKVNNRVPDNFFSVEAKSLTHLESHYPGRIPKVISEGKVDGYYYLLTDFVESSNKAKDYWIRLGENLAVMHQNTQSSFGFEFDNFIGSLPQKNDEFDSWPEFFWEMRLYKQLDLAHISGLVDSLLLQKFEKLKTKLSDFFPVEAPAFIHGDLWSGNLMVDESGYPALIDPAIYFGHREIELAFTQLFGGFDRSFLESYHQVFNLEPGYEDRFDLYNLYPLLVHLNLFGTSYLGNIKRILDRFL